MQLVVRRSDPKGLLFYYDVTADRPIVRVEFDMLDDDEPAQVITFPVEVGTDGRFFKGFAFKPTINGTFPLQVRVQNDRGDWGAVTCRPGVTVTF